MNKTFHHKPKEFADLAREIKGLSEYDPAWGLEDQILRGLGLKRQSSSVWTRLKSWFPRPVYAGLAGAAAVFLLVLLQPVFIPKGPVQIQPPAPRMASKEIAGVVPKAKVPAAAGIQVAVKPEPTSLPATGTRPAPLAASVTAPRVHPPKAPSNSSAPLAVASGAPLLSGSRAPVPADAPKAAAARKEPENPIATPRAWKYGLSLRNNVFKPGQGEGVSVELTLDKPGRVEAAVLKAGGGLVKALYSGDMPGGPSVYSWDGTDASGRPAPSGFYWLVLKSPGKTEKLKVVLAR